MNQYTDTKYKILLISPEKWEKIKLSKHHYASFLAKQGHIVFFLNPPSNKFEITKIDNNLFIVDYKSLFPGLRFLPSKIAALLIAYELKRLEQHIEFKINIIWNFEFSRFFNVSRLSDSITILHIVDYDLITNTRRSVIDQAAQTFGYTIGISNAVCAALKQHNGIPIKIGHGYSFVHKSTIDACRTSHKVNVGYVGNLLITYIDWGIIYEIVLANPNIGFHFIGPLETSNLGSASKNQFSNIEAIQQLSNTYFLGPIDSKYIHSSLSQFDVLLIAYLSEQYPNEVANPHKVLEYLGTGKVIVSTYLEEYADLTELIEMALDRTQLIGVFNTVVNNLDKYNNLDLTRKRIHYAQSNDYDTKVREIFSSFRLS